MANIIINIVESFVLVIFVTRYHSIKINRLTYLFFAICFGTQMLFTLQGQSDWFSQTAILSILLYMYQFLVFRQDNQLYFFASQTAIYIIMLSNIISLLLLTAVSIPVQNYLNLAIFVSKLMSIIIMLLFAKTARVEADSSTIFIFNVGVGLVMILSHVLIQPLLRMDAVASDYILSVGIIVLSILMFVFLQRAINYQKMLLQKDHQLKQQHLKDTYSQKLERVNHMFKYYMLSVMHKAKDTGAVEVADVAKDYVSKILCPNFNVDTGNYYFDLHLSRLIFDYLQYDITINADIKLKSQSKVNDTVMADKVINDIRDTLQTINKRNPKEINIKIEEKDSFLLLTFIVDTTIDDLHVCNYNGILQLKKMVF